MPDERAVLVEPLAGGIHAALVAARAPSVVDADAPLIAVLGAGTMGLAAVAGLVRYVPTARVVVGARYPHQQAARPGPRRPRGGAVVASSSAPCDASTAAGWSATRCRAAPTPSIDAVGSAASLGEALRITRPAAGS